MKFHLRSEPRLVSVGLLCAFAVAGCGRDALRQTPEPAEPATVGHLDAPQRVDFGSVYVGTAAEQTLSLRAVDAQVAVQSITANSPSLSVDSWQPTVLSPGEVLPVTLRWLPTEAGPLEALLTVAADPTGAVVNVVGTAIEAGPCDDDNPCTEDGWDNELEQCTHTPAQGACDDGDPCTVSDQCWQGSCQGVFDATAAPECQPDSQCDPDGRLQESPFSGRWFEEIWSSGANDTWAVGAAGIALHDAGDGWQVIDTCVSQTLFSVYGFASDDVWAAGGGGTLLHWRGQGWEAVNLDTTATLWGVWGFSSNDLWVVGDNGSTWHKSAAGWTPYPTNQSTILYSAWGSSPSDIWAVGDYGVMVHFDGDSWSAASVPTSESLFAVRGTSRDNVWAVGMGGTILRYDGDKWGLVDSGTLTSLFSVWGTGASDYWVSGQGGAVRHFSTDAWSEHTVPSGGNMYGLFGAGAYLWAAGSGGVMNDFDGSAWNPAN